MKEGSLLAGEVGVSDLSEKGITSGWGNLGGPGKWPHPKDFCDTAEPTFPET